ncbi:MAG: Mrp/NBP35 family ATP-binding protein [Verrucomicrobia bacterium]|nr:Mrp/NBP35 family ATP-binding protein [Verrucomicrobiota bacterium]MDA1065693.1 Mrp/NBP35 family ATP-binding protein [Verrucomicrobiota bacterium]
MSSDNSLLKALSTIKYPGFSRDIVSFGLVRAATLNEGNASIQLAITTSDPRIPVDLKKEVETVLGNLEEVTNVEVEIAVSKPKSTPPSQAGGGDNQQKPSLISGVKKIIAVASGKGGVGKSTFSVNLACAFDHVLNEALGSSAVGIMDCDVYGPSIPLMMGVRGRPSIVGESLVPVENLGIKTMSMGLLVDSNTPVIWRGPMVNKTIQQFAQNVNWGNLDVLVVDLPPGTGDAQLSLAQNIPLNGAVIVTTPQEAAVSVTTRGARMFDKVNIPILGVAENMSYYLNPASGEKEYIFGTGGGEKAAAELNTELLGKIPLDPAIRTGGDMGIPIVKSAPNSETAQAFYRIAEKILEKLS